MLTCIMAPNLCILCEEGASPCRDVRAANEKRHAVHVTERLAHKEVGARMSDQVVRANSQLPYIFFFFP